jgi:hypothetical protein
MAWITIILKPALQITAVRKHGSPVKFNVTDLAQHRVAHIGRFGRELRFGYSALNQRPGRDHLLNGIPGQRRNKKKRKKSVSHIDLLP